MSALLVMAGSATAVALVIVKALAVDEVRGRIQRRVAERLEATIATLPPELQREWADEWRAELRTVISMPIAAARLARGLRLSASELAGERCHSGANLDARVPARSDERRRGMAKLPAVAKAMVDREVRRRRDPRVSLGAPLVAIVIQVGAFLLARGDLARAANALLIIACIAVFVIVLRQHLQRRRRRAEQPPA